MTTRPILFSAPMVLAIRSGTKTQTRRIAKPQTDSCGDPILPGDPRLKCPHGQPGHSLWVKETWRTSRSLDHCKPIGLREGAPIAYEADGRTNINNHERGPLLDAGRIRQSIFMRQWMSRITLSITDIRVHRLQDITEEDAYAEGYMSGASKMEIALGYKKRGPIHWYEKLWTTLHGPDSWHQNPYVWAITFANIERPTSNIEN